MEILIISNALKISSTYRQFLSAKINLQVFKESKS